MTVSCVKAKNLYTCPTWHLNVFFLSIGKCHRLEKRYLIVHICDIPPFCAKYYECKLIETKRVLLCGCEHLSCRHFDNLLFKTVFFLSHLPNLTEPVLYSGFKSIPCNCATSFLLPRSHISGKII